MDTITDQKTIPNYVRSFSAKFFGYIQDKPLEQQKIALKSLVKQIKKLYKSASARNNFMQAFARGRIYNRKLNYLTRLLEQGNLNKIKIFVIRWHTRTNLVEELNQMMTSLVIYAIDNGYRHHLHFLLKLIRNDDKKLRSLCFASDEEGQGFLDRLLRLDNDIGENLTNVLLKRMPLNLIYSRLLDLMKITQRQDRARLRRCREVYLRLIPVVEKKKGFLKMLKDIAEASPYQHPYIYEDLKARVFNNN